MLQKIIHFRFLGTVVFLLGFIGASYVNATIGEEGGAHVPFIPDMWLYALMPIGALIGAIHIGLKSGRKTSMTPQTTPKNASKNVSVDETPQDRANLLSIALMVGGALLAFLPMIAETLSNAPGQELWGPGDPGNGVGAMWLMLFTLPIGGVIFLSGLFMAIARASRRARD